MRKVYTIIDQISGNVIRLKASNVGFDDIAVVESEHVTSLAQVIRLQNDDVYLQVFAGTKGISTGDRVRFLGHPMEVSFSDNLLGRIFSGNGKPRDGRSVLTDNMISIDGPSVNPAKRMVPQNMIRTGIPMIDLFNTLVESQKLPIFSVPGEPYNPLLARIALQAEADIIVFGGMGLKYDDYLFFKNTFDKGGVLSRSIMFVHTASDPIVECLLVPDLVLAVAENFAVQQNKKVLVLLTDMTSYADALKE
ncbi:MAG TPA: V-type ATP synthase subunit B, partial [Planctomycetota bacterium]|nr:V-type ATP synthase subunit B [Planctomycetota bacterium]